MIEPLTPDRLIRRCDTARFAFSATADLEDLAEGIGQMRAIEAAHFGIGMHHAGYNLYVMGPPGSGKRTLIRLLLDGRAGGVPSDWCYVHNFAQPHKPRAIRLPAGMGARFRDDMQQLVTELQSAIPAVFEGEDYRRRLSQIDEEYAERQSQAFGSVGDDAMRHGVILLRTPNGFSFAPAKDEEVMPPDDYDKLPDVEKARIEQEISRLQGALEKAIRQVLCGGGELVVLWPATAMSACPPALAARCVTVDSTDPHALARAVRREAASCLVLGGHSRLVLHGKLAPVLDTIECPVVLSP